MQLTSQKKQVLDMIVNDLSCIPEIRAVVLGGSYATGQASETSDIDVGIYYHEKNPFSIKKIKHVAEKYAISTPLVITDFYEWGPWVNGGAWINTSIGKVDFLYRNIEQVANTIEKAKNGEWENNYEQQPPYGFSSIIYLAECQMCIPLFDPDHILAYLKKEVHTYPPKLKQTIIHETLWSAEFTLMQADSFLVQQDVYNITGCLTRAVKSITSALFAINEMYPIGDKRAIETLAQYDKKPNKLAELVESILCVNKRTLNENIETAKQLFAQTVGLSEGRYQPLYKL